MVTATATATTTTQAKHHRLPTTDALSSSEVPSSSTSSSSPSGQLKQLKGPLHQQHYEESQSPLTQLLPNDTTTTTTTTSATDAASPSVSSQSAASPSSSPSSSPPPPSYSFYEQHCYYLVPMAGWFLFSALLSSYNKRVFGSKGMAFPCPLLMTSLHFCAQCLFAETACALYPRALGSSRISQMSWSEYFSTAIPCGLVTSGDIGLSNLSWVTLSLTFYTMIKSSTPIFVLLWAYIFGLTKITAPLIGVVILITLGEYIAVAGHVNEDDFQWSGFILCVAASVLSGARWTLVQLKIQSMEPPLKTTIATMRLLAPSMFVSLLTVSLLLERPWYKLRDQVNSLGDAINILALGLFGALFAICMILCEFYLIMKANAIVITIGGVIKEVVTIWVGVVFFGDEFTWQRFAGCCVIFAGVILYKFTFTKTTTTTKTTTAAAARRNTTGVTGVAPPPGPPLLQNPRSGGSSAPGVKQRHLQQRHHSSSFSTDSQEGQPRDSLDPRGLLMMQNHKEHSSERDLLLQQDDQEPSGATLTSDDEDIMVQDELLSAAESGDDGGANSSVATSASTDEWVIMSTPPSAETSGSGGTPPAALKGEQRGEQETAKLIMEASGSGDIELSKKKRSSSGNNNNNNKSSAS